MGGRSGKAILAAALSLVVPGAGQLYLGERRRALVLFALFAACCVAALLVVGDRPRARTLVRRTRRSLAALLLANAAVLGSGCSPSSMRGARRARVARRPPSRSPCSPSRPQCRTSPRRTSRSGATACSTRSSPSEEPKDVVRGRLLLAGPLVGRAPGDLDPPGQRPLRALPGAAAADRCAATDAARRLRATRRDEQDELDPPWVTILLLGSDEGPGRRATRTDTMIVAALQRETGRAVLFGVPRNLVGVPRARTSAGATTSP